MLAIPTPDWSLTPVTEIAAATYYDLLLCWRVCVSSTSGVGFCRDLPAHGVDVITAAQTRVSMRPIRGMLTREECFHRLSFAVSSAARTAAMWAGVLPQHSPMMRAPLSRTLRAYAPIISGGLS